MLKSVAKIDIVSVNYRGGAQGLQDVIAGQVHMMFSDPASGIVQAQAGKVRALGVSSATRLAVAPDIPTITESGLPFAIELWEMLAAPAGTPAPIVARINAELRAVLALPDIQKQLNDRGQIPRGQPAAAGTRGVREGRDDPLGQHRTGRGAGRLAIARKRCGASARFNLRFDVGRTAPNCRVPAPNRPPTSFSPPSTQVRRVVPQFRRQTSGRFRHPVIARCGAPDDGSQAEIAKSKSDETVRHFHRQAITPPVVGCQLYSQNRDPLDFSLLAKTCASAQAPRPSVNDPS